MSIKFTSGLQEFIFNDPPQFPSSAMTELVQVKERTAAGTLQTESFGVTINKFELAFKDMQDTDYQGLLEWFISVADGIMNSFFYTDTNGYVTEVRFTNSTIDFDETSYRRYAGKITLEKV